MISYPHTFVGLMASYTAGIPFLRNQILGDLFFSSVLFGGFALLQRRFEVLKMA
jgi:formate-dependent nitrite reductase membrane component NrfD